LSSRTSAGTIPGTIPGSMAMRLRRPWQPALPDQEVSPASGRNLVDHGSLWSGLEGLSDKDLCLSSKLLLSPLFF
jgi:hypothetical protein